MDRARWHALTLPQQMGNIGSEIARARHFEGQGDKDRRDAAIERALELIDLTRCDGRRRTGLREIARLREVVCAWYVGSAAYDVSPAALQKYCTSFALLAAAAGRA
jgi:hypothetical protein